MIESLQSEQTLLYKRLIQDLEIDESVAAYACLQTDFRSVTDVVEYLWDPFFHEPSGKTIMQHPFVGYDPDLDDSGNNSDARKAGAQTVCFLCGGTKEQHLQVEDQAQAGVG